MTQPHHPDDALFAGEILLPALQACEHFAGSRKMIEKALALQVTLGPVFDVTADCEDGAVTGQEQEHVAMIAGIATSDANVYRQLGVRIHDPSHAFWRQDVDTIVERAGEQIAYITIPKVTAAGQAVEVADYIRAKARTCGLTRSIPLHILIETQGALRDVDAIAQVPDLQVLDFGLMDFVSDHQGAIAASQMRSPGQFEHRLIVRAKAEMAAAALRNGVVPAHNVCLNLKDQDVVRADARRAREDFGYLRMWSIYPDQIMPIVEAMRPDFNELLDAAAILIAAQDANWGPVQYNGELHDRATYRYFWQLLKRGKATGMPIPDAADRRFFTKASSI